MELPTHVACAADDEETGRIALTRRLTTDQLQGFCDPRAAVNHVVKELRSNTEKGLTSAEAASRLLQYGPNQLEQKGRMPLFLLFLSQFINMIICILGIAATVSMIIGEFVEGIAVIVIILITVGMSTFTEYSSGNALEALSQLTDPHSHVIRDGKVQIVRTPELVPGDIVELSPGDLVPADIRIVQASAVKVNEMILTGESADVSKKENASAGESSTKLTNVNMVYSSTSLVEGKLKVLRCALNII